MRESRWHEEETEPGVTADRLALLRDCLLRTIGWSVLAGALLGVGYILPLIIPYSDSRNLTPSGIDIWLRAIVSLGAGSGAIIGLIVGFGTGLVLATVLLFLPGRHRRTRWYPPLLGAVGTMASLLGLWGERHLLGVPYLLPAAGPSHVAVGPDFGAEDTRLWRSEDSRRRGLAGYGAPPDLGGASSGSATRSPLKLPNARRRIRGEMREGQWLNRQEIRLLQERYLKPSSTPPSGVPAL